MNGKKAKTASPTLIITLKNINMKINTLKDDEYSTSLINLGLTFLLRVPTFLNPSSLYY